MCTLENVRVFVDQRLAAFAEEIFEVIERTMREYEEQLRRQQDLKLLTAAFQPQVRINRADVQQLTLSKEIPPEQQERTISLKQEEPPELPNIKEEEEEPWTEVTFTHLPVSVKVKDNHEDEPQPTQLHPRDHINDAVFDDDSSDGTGLDRNVNPEPDPDNCSSDWEDPVEHQSDLILQQNTQTPLDKEECSGGETFVESSDCPPSSDLQGNLEEGNQVQTEENPSTFGSKGWNLERNNKNQKSRPHLASKRYTCLICNKTFTFRTHVEKHMALHTGEKPLSCFLCGISFKTSARFEAHLQLHTGEGPFTCSPPNSDLQGNLQEGSQVQTEENPSPFGSKGRNLERTHTEPSRTKGEEQLLVIKAEWSPGLEQDEPPELPQVKDDQKEVWTSQEGGQLGGLEEAQKIQFTLTPVPVKSEEDDKGQKPSGILMEGSVFSCSVCGKTFPNKEKRRKHMICHREKTFSCSICKKTFPTPCQLRRHMMFHKEEKPFSCSVCKKTFTQKSDLTRHMNTHKEKPFSCSVCKKMFTQKSVLTRHMNTHKKEKPFSCSVCRKTFTLKSDVTRHMSTHMDDKSFSCSVCQKSFGLQFYLKRHMLCHLSEKPFSCSVCKKSFPRQYLMWRHMLCHKDEKPFSCSVCKKAFTRKSDMKSHMFIHKEEKPFSCSICKKVFTRRSNMKSHMFIHRDKKPFSCSICKKPFLKKLNLKRHVACHKEKPFSLLKKNFSRTVPSEVSHGLPQGGEPVQLVSGHQGKLFGPDHIAAY